MTTQHTAPTPTDLQIRALRREADSAGDLDQVAVCLIALGADPSDAEPGTALATCTLTREQALAECARVIAAAKAMED